MGLQSARFSGDRVLDQRLAGTHRMFAPEENLSVMPVVGPGTAGTLDTLLLHSPPALDFDFGEIAGFVAAHVVEPSPGFELQPLIDAPLDYQRRDVGISMLDALRTGHCLGMVAGSRAGDLQDPRNPADLPADLANLGPDAGRVSHFIGTDGVDHVVMVLDDLTIRGRRF